MNKWLSLITLCLPFYGLAQSCLNSDLSGYQVSKTAYQTLEEKILEDKSNLQLHNLYELPDQYLIESARSEDLAFRRGDIPLYQELDEYLNKIADYILENTPDLRSQVHFYTSLSTPYNAWTYANGHIYFSIELLAKIASEAQLAFILGHEVSHYSLQHAFKAQDNTQKETEGYKRLNSEQQEVIRLQFSRANELEADAHAFKILLKNTDYSRDELLRTFPNMHYSDLSIYPPDSIVQYLEQMSGMKFPQEYSLPSIAPIAEMMDTNDSSSTHPNTKTRLEELTKWRSQESGQNNVKFHFSEGQFREIQTKARLLLSQQYLSNLQFEEAILHSYSLLSEGEAVTCHEKAIGFGLMQLAHYKSKDDFFRIHTDYQYIQGPAQAFYYLMEQMTDTEASLLAILFNWHLHQKNPKDLEILKILDKSFEILVMELNQSRESVDSSMIPEYCKKALVPHRKSISFNALWKKHEQLKEEDIAHRKELIANPELRKELMAEKNIIQKKGFALGIDTLVIVNPIVLTSDFPKISPRSIQQSSKMRQKLMETFQRISSEIGLNTTILDLKTMKPKDINTYHDYVKIAQWFDEKCTHTSDDYLLFHEVYSKELIDKYHTKYFAWTAWAEGNVFVFYLFDIQTGDILLAQKDWKKISFTNKEVKQTLLQIKTSRN